MSNQYRDLTEEEILLVPTFFDDAYFDLENNIYKASWGNHFLRSDDLKAPWIFNSNDQEISTEDLEDAFPGYKRIKDLESRTLVGRARVFIGRARSKPGPLTIIKKLPFRTPTNQSQKMSLTQKVNKPKSPNSLKALQKQSPLRRPNYLAHKHLVQAHHILHRHYQVPFP
jgi:hypothetical protein